MIGRTLASPFGPETTRTGASGTASLALIYAAIYLKDWASGWMGSMLALYLLVAGLLVGLAGMASRRAPFIGLQRGTLQLALAFLAAWTLTLAVTQTANLSSYYLAIPCAFVVRRVEENGLHP